MTFLELWWDRNTRILARVLAAKQLRLQTPHDGASWHIWTIEADKAAL